MNGTVLYLASQSPRRRELLQQLGYGFVVVHVDVPELPGKDETPGAYVQRVAQDKLLAGLAALPRAADIWVLSADTEVVLDGEVFGQPRDAEAAAAMLRRLAGRTHEVLSAVWLGNGERMAGALCCSRVRLAALDEARIAAYVASGEPFGKAGGYAIQGRAAAFVEHLDGSYSGVMGLPLFETAGLLRRFDIARRR